MQLAYLSSQYPSLSMTFVLREVRQLRALGHQVAVASINPSGRASADLTQEEREEAQQVYCVKSHGIAGALTAHACWLLRHPGAWLAGWRDVLRRSGPDLRALALHTAYLSEGLMIARWMAAKGLRHLHVHQGQQASTVGLYVQTAGRVGFSVTIHGPAEFHDVSRYYLAEKVTRADFMICISQYARSQVMRLGTYEHWAKLLVCPLGVDLQRFAPAAARAERDAAQAFEILCVGRLTPAKGQHLLIEAVARLRAAGHAVQARIVGAGDDDASLNALRTRLGVEDCVYLEGGVNQDRIGQFFARADCFCLPSFAEGVPVALMEAMAMEIPCVSTRITGIPELIDDGVDGLLATASDLEGLIDRLSLLIRDQALCARLGAAARRKVELNYNLHTNVARLASLMAKRVPD